ncbi:MAG: hypothetical protein H9535_05780 [Ignavibacteria bacterium]|nr:hypothetical protein [Ignavibacteria bacterium]
MGYMINTRGQLVNDTIAVTRTFVTTEGGMEVCKFVIDDLYAPKPDEMKVIERWETAYFCKEQPIATDKEHSFLKDKGVWFSVSAATFLWCCIYFFSTH